MGLFFSPPSWAKTPAKAQAQLIAQQASLAPGSRSYLGLQLNMEPGWHTYWQNPGDSGLPTKIQWHNVPDGITLHPIEWPVPHYFLVGSQINYGYEKETVLLIPFEVSESLAQSTKPITLSGTASWLSCRESCIQEKQSVSIDLQIGPNTKVSNRISEALTHLPLPLTTPLKIVKNQSGFHFELESTTPIKQLMLISNQESQLKPDLFITPERLNNHYRFTLQPSPYLAQSPATMSGLVVLRHPNGSEQGYTFNNITVHQQPSP